MIQKMLSGLRNIKNIRDLELTDKVVFLRLDLNVPTEDGKITDETRIRESLPTIQHVLERGAKLVIASHLGRPKSAGDKKYSLEPVANRLTELIKKEVVLVEEPSSDAIAHLLSVLKKDQVILLENLRYESGETENSEKLAQKWASFTQVYINDAFGASHRAHASIEALPRLVSQKGIGFLIEKEINMLDKLLENPQKPYIAILGGSKISDKIPVIEKLLDIVDGFIIGGAMAYTFLKAQGISVGTSLVEVNKLGYAREMIERIKSRNKSLLLPVDHLVATDIKADRGEITSGQSIDNNVMGVDIGPKTISQFRTAILSSATVFWNGPMGVFENKAFSKGTFAIAEALAECSAIKIIGGGDSAAAVTISGYASKMTHISTGGGASLEYLQGDKLPGLEVLRQKPRIQS